VPRISQACHTDGDVWRFDSCGNRLNETDDCTSSETCSDGVCRTGLYPAPVLVSPSNGASLSSSSGVTFDWNDASGATSATLYLLKVVTSLSAFSEDDDVCGPDCVASATTRLTEHTFSRLGAVGATYYWRVKAYDSSRDGAWSSTRSFSIACSDECVAGARRCTDSGYQICGNFDGDSCLEWSSTSSCP